MTTAPAAVTAVRTFLRAGVTATELSKAERQLGGLLRRLAVRDGACPPRELVSTLWRIDCHLSNDVVRKNPAEPLLKGFEPGDEVVTLILCWSASDTLCRTPKELDIDDAYTIRRYPPQLRTMVPAQRSTWNSFR